MNALQYGYSWFKKMLDISIKQHTSEIEEGAVRLLSALLGKGKDGR